MNAGRLAGTEPALTALLPKRAFTTAPQKLWIALLHLLIVGAGYWGMRHAVNLPGRAVLSLVIGHSMACVAFLTHELSHGTVVRGRARRYGLEVLLWGMNLIPATVWRRVHNQTHHAHTNTRRDPDRRFTVAEKSALTGIYSRIFYPHRHTLKWNPLVAFHFVPYIIRNTMAAFYGAASRPRLVPFKPVYSARQRAHILVELIVIAVVQMAIFRAVGRNWTAYLWASPVAVLVTSAIVMAYVFTNHFTNPLLEAPDTIAGTTSVVVPRVFDSLHFNFSYHTEHHLFPRMRSEFYPLVSEHLRLHHRARYSRVPIGKAWAVLWAGDEYAFDPAGTETVDNLAQAPCPVEATNASTACE